MCLVEDWRLRPATTYSLGAKSPWKGSALDTYVNLLILLDPPAGGYIRTQPLRVRTTEGGRSLYPSKNAGVTDEVGS